MFHLLPPSLLSSCAFFFFLLHSTALAAPAPSPKLFLSSLRLPAGFKISVFASSVPYVRSLVRDDSQEGTFIFAGSWDPTSTNADPTDNTTSNTSVYALIDKSNRGYATTIVNATVPLFVPNGVAMLGTTLYVASISTIYGFDYAALRVTGGKFNMTPDYRLKLLPESPALPTQGWHGWRYLESDEAQNHLYMGVGAPCNVPGDIDLYCANTADTTASNSLYTTIQRLVVDRQRNTATLVKVAEGMRNTVGLLVLPGRNELWWTDNGRDRWSSDLPPDELNVIRNLNVTTANSAKHFGFPFCYGQGLADPSFNAAGDCSPYQNAFQNLGAHAAALGLDFYPSRGSNLTNDSFTFSKNSSRFPNSYGDSFFIAEHGSWNSIKPQGYRVTRVSYNYSTGRPDVYEPFITGWLPETPVSCQTNDDCIGNAVCQINATQEQNASGPFYCGGWGRPVDVLILKDGSMLISDDLNGVVYRVYYDDTPPPLPWYEETGYIVVMSVMGVLLLIGLRIIIRVQSIVFARPVNQGPVVGEMARHTGPDTAERRAARDRYARLYGEVQDR
eukprot:gb/GEZN01003820.1/.p1 GENE.gb/GEZN01003820.1/~~gb/GEZN01003820.1/.p1  ORF type:complete len:559 (+),score=44.46 gb/GEZN01003820.1/:131-1807(+)